MTSDYHDFLHSSPPLAVVERLEQDPDFCAWFAARVLTKLNARTAAQPASEYDLLLLLKYGKTF